MHFLHLLSILLGLSVIALAQLNTLPPCVQTCLHNAIPSCSGLKCYCNAFTSPLLLAASACYHSTCDSTTPTPYQVLIADIGPLCFQANAPIDHAELSKAAAAASSSSFSTYISFSDAASTGGMTSAPSVAAMPTETPAAQSVTFEINTRNRLGEVAGTASSRGGAAGGVDRGDGWVVGVVLAVSGVVLELLG